MEIIKTFDIEFEEVNDTDKEAYAAIAQNEQFTLLKYILTDTSPNFNKQRIPQEEFANLLKTGIFTPFKKAIGKINNGHEEAIPIGVNTHLRNENDKIVAIAALWNKEYSDDVETIKEAYSSKTPLNVSWEINYKDSAISDDGVEDLLQTTLRAVTLVGLPAYKGRTPVLAVASEQNNEEDTKLEELEQLKAEVTDLKTKLTEAQSAVAEASELKTKLQDAETELLTLREFKSAIDKKEEEAEKLESVKTKFSEAGLEKDEEYFVENKAVLLSLAPEALDFMIQDLATFAKGSQDAKSSKKEIPAITPTDKNLADPKEIADALRRRFAK